jgi:cysteine desulfurase/selenocysteine lyase
MPEFNVLKIRKDFPILSTTTNGKPLIYLDSAATSQKPQSMINAVSEFYKSYNANIHRGIYEISVKATEAYQESKETVSKFINASSYREIVYCKNTTDAINTVALSWGDSNIAEGDTILLSEMEHHSNIVPWQLLAKRKKAKVEYIKIGDDFKLNMEDYKAKLENNPKLVSFTHISNVLGSINNAKEMAKMAHGKGALVFLDAAQSVPHLPVDVTDIDCDFMAFSGHKMLGPAGIGVLYAKDSILEEMPPVIGGGDMIRSVTFEGSSWNELPWKFEAGTPNTEGAIGLKAGIEYLKSCGMENIHKHEEDLTRHALESLEEAGAIIYGISGKNALRERTGVISFKLEGAHPHDIATILSSEGIAIRAGHHCAMPLINKVLQEPALARMSFYLYNTTDEIDLAINALGKVKKILGIKSGKS